MKFLAALFVFIPIFSFAEEDQKIGRDEVRQVIKKNINSLKTCYTDGLKNNPNIEGKVVMEWEIAIDGTVSSAGVKSSALKDEAVEKCIVDKIKALKFSGIPNGNSAKVLYPFVFQKSK